MSLSESDMNKSKPVDASYQLHLLRYFDIRPYRLSVENRTVEHLLHHFFPAINSLIFI